MVRPMPAPRKNPPKTEINNLSLVTTGYGIVATATANREIAAALFRLNILPIWCQANMMKGRLIIMIRNAKGNFVFSWINNEIPVTPPSIKSFGIKNPFNSKPAESTPRSMNRTSRAVCKAFCLSCFTLFADMYRLKICLSVLPRVF